LEEGINPHICVTDNEEDRRIEIMCPGVPVHAISLRRLPNGVRVEIKGGMPGGGDLEQDFHYDYQTQGKLELREDECAYNDGVLLVVLKRVPNQWMKLGRRGTVTSPPQTPPAAVVEGGCPQLFSLTTFRSSADGGGDATYEQDWALLASVPDAGVEAEDGERLLREPSATSEEAVYEADWTCARAGAPGGPSSV
jgi:hypothetical protein